MKFEEANYPSVSWSFIFISALFISIGSKVFSDTSPELHVERSVTEFGIALERWQRAQNAIRGGTTEGPINDFDAAIGYSDDCDVHLQAVSILPRVSHPDTFSAADLERFNRFRRGLEEYHEELFEIYLSNAEEFFNSGCVAKSGDRIEFWMSEVDRVEAEYRDGWVILEDILEQE